MTRYLISFDDGAMTSLRRRRLQWARPHIRWSGRHGRQGPSEARLLEPFQLQTLACVRRDGTPCGASRFWPCSEPLAS